MTASRRHESNDTAWQLAPAAREPPKSAVEPQQQCEPELLAIPSLSQGRVLARHRATSSPRPTHQARSADSRPQPRDASTALWRLVTVVLPTPRVARQGVCRRASTDQLLHGEPHPGNLLDTREGPLFIDFETCCRGPIEFDVAHVPEDVAVHYPGVDQVLLQECRRLVLAMIAAWRWDVRDEFPDGRRHGLNILDILRKGPPWPTLGALSTDHRGTQR
ncbi:phosphotransferase family protein [Luteipulveratus mongoliensis]|uniref:phosphotransferase family protein n=1 Tax=Luteipulveratus mongoliensis TaxID=571913 RepID=UPI00248022FD|nr:phosphotransferase [Luteipulveratus mongoliensis]